MDRRQGLPISLYLRQARVRNSQECGQPDALPDLLPEEGKSRYSCSGRLLSVDELWENLKAVKSGSKLGIKKQFDL